MRKRLKSLRLVFWMGSDVTDLCQVGGDAGNRTNMIPHSSSVSLNYYNSFVFNGQGKMIGFMRFGFALKSDSKWSHFGHCF